MTPAASCPSGLEKCREDLSGKFWTGLRPINPDQADLALTPEHYESWRAALEIRGDGQPRLSAWLRTAPSLG